MTAAQQQAIQQIRQQLLRTRGSTNETDRWEVKYESITEAAYKRVYYVVEIGQKGDEGTAAAILCRPRTHVAIGPQGGLEVLDINGKHKRTMHGAVWADVIARQQREKRKAREKKEEL